MCIRDSCIIITARCRLHGTSATAFHSNNQCSTPALLHRTKRIIRSEMIGLYTYLLRAIKLNIDATCFNTWLFSSVYCVQYKTTAKRYAYLTQDHVRRTAANRLRRNRSTTENRFAPVSTGRNWFHDTRQPIASGLTAVVVHRR